MSPEDFLRKWGNKTFLNSMINVMVSRDQEIDSLTGLDFLAHGMTHRRVKSMESDARKAGLLDPHDKSISTQKLDRLDVSVQDKALLRILSWAITQEKAILQGERRLIEVMRQPEYRQGIRMHVSLSNMFMVDPTNLKDCQRAATQFADHLHNPQKYAMDHETACQVTLEGTYSDLPEQKLFVEAIEATWNAAYAGATLREGMPANETTEFNDPRESDEASSLLMRLQWDCEAMLPEDQSFWDHLHNLEGLYNEMALQAWSMLSMEDNPYQIVTLTHPDLEDETMDLPFLLMDMRDPQRVAGQATISWEQTMTRILEHNTDTGWLSSDFAP